MCVVLCCVCAYMFVCSGELKYFRRKKILRLAVIGAWKLGFVFLCVGFGICFTRNLIIGRPDEVLPHWHIQMLSPSMAGDGRGPIRNMPVEQELFLFVFSFF